MLEKRLALCTTSESTWLLLLCIIFTRVSLDRKQNLATFFGLELPNPFFPALTGIKFIYMDLWWEGWLIFHLIATFPQTHHHTPIATLVANVQTISILYSQDPLCYLHRVGLPSFPIYSFGMKSIPLWILLNLIKNLAGLPFSSRKAVAIYHPLKEERLRFIAYFLRCVIAKAFFFLFYPNNWIINQLIIFFT